MIFVKAGATIEGNDLSLFYGNITELTTITPERKFLPKELYSAMVLDSVICCVDILAVRYNAVTQQKECLLVERGSEPVKGVWWLPGKKTKKMWTTNNSKGYMCIYYYILYLTPLSPQTLFSFSD